jgi:hypothetical protein
MRRPDIPSMLALGLALAVAGCGQREGDVTPNTDAMHAQVKEDGSEVPAFSEATRTAFQPTADVDPGARGTLRLLVPIQAVKEDVPMTLHVQLAGLQPGAHAWNIYGASCSVEHPPILISLSGTPDTTGIVAPLEVKADSTAEAEVPVPPLRALWVEAGDYSVRVFAGVGDRQGVMVTCADL